jgi:hypothetical protein
MKMDVIHVPVAVHVETGDTTATKASMPLRETGRHFFIGSLETFDGIKWLAYPESCIMKETSIVIRTG